MAEEFRTKLLRDQFLYGASVQFFPPVMARIEKAFKEWDIYEESQNAVIGKVIPAILDPDALIPFIAYYFHGLQKREIDGHDWNAHPLLKASQMQDGKFSQTKRFSEEGRRGPKPVGTHFLTSAEYESAYDYITNQHPELLPATFLIKDCINAYLDSFGIAIETSKAPVLNETINALLLKAIRDKLEGGTISDPFFQEFLPIFSSRAANSKHEPLSPQSVSAGLQPFFREGAMQGLRENKANPETKYCPFKKAMGQIMNARFDWNENGKVTLQEGLEPAGLLKFALRFLEKHEAISSSPTPQPKPSQ